ncbi:MAG: Bug family tripartite tricarboxylate transporter substrate binding protein [Burkholderiales bacterium]
MRLNHLARIVLAIGASATMCVHPANAQQIYPAKPVTLIVSTSTGTTPDLLARSMAPRLAQRIGQSVIVDNKVGASGNIGAMAVVKAPPDGHTVLITTNNLSSIQYFVKEMPFDPVVDLEPVMKLAIAMYSLVINPNVPAQTVQEFIALAKAKPGAMNYSTPGVGSPHHLSMELFKQRTDIAITHVPYKGSATSLTDVLGGQIEATFTPMNTVIPLVRAGKLRMLATATDKRTSWLPDVPTLAEQGIDGVDPGAWGAMFLPRGTPAPIVKRLLDDTTAVLSEPALRDSLLERGVVLSLSTPEGLTKLLKDDLARWKIVVERGRLNVQ